MKGLVRRAGAAGIAAVLLAGGAVAVTAEAATPPIQLSAAPPAFVVDSVTLPEIRAGAGSLLTFTVPGGYTAFGAASAVRGTTRRSVAFDPEAIGSTTWSMQLGPLPQGSWTLEFSAYSQETDEQVRFSGPLVVTADPATDTGRPVLAGPVSRTVAEAAPQTQAATGDDLTFLAPAGASLADARVSLFEELHGTDGSVEVVPLPGTVTVRRAADGSSLSFAAPTRTAAGALVGRSFFSTRIVVPAFGTRFGTGPLTMDAGLTLTRPGYRPKPEPAGPLASGINRGQGIYRGQALVSGNGIFEARMQFDGALVVQKVMGKRRLWSSGANGGAWTEVTTDGGLRQQTADFRTVWSAGSARGVLLQMGNDGRLALLDGDRIVWRTPTLQKVAPETPRGRTDRLFAYQALHRGGGGLTSANGRYTLTVKAQDGNLVLRRVSDGRALWSTGPRPDADWLHNQTDGNVVLYRSDGKALWSTGSAGRGLCDLVLQDDGNLVVRSRATGRPVWSSGVRG